MVLVLLATLICVAGIVQFTRVVRAAAPTALDSCTSSIAPGKTMTCVISTAAEVDSITLTGTSGDVYLLRVAITAGDMRPLVGVHAPDGTMICQASGPYSPGTEIARCVLTQSGIQTIRISDTATTRTGSYNLYVQRLSVPVNPTPLLIGQTVTSTISTGAEATTFSLTGIANEAYLIRMGVTAGTLRPIVRVFGADGTAICTASQPYAPGTEIARCVLPQSGIFTVLATDTSAIQTGSYNLYAQRLTAPIGATALTMGSTSTATIQASSEADTYTVTGSANAVFLLRMGVTAGDLRPNVRVFGSDGSVLCAASQPYAFGTEISRCVLPQSGTFTVLATDTSATTTGSYNLYVQQITAPVGIIPLAWGETMSTTLLHVAELNSYTVQARASDVLLLRVMVTAGEMRPVVTVFDPDGVSICTASSPYSSGTEVTRCLIPRDGTFLVMVGDTSATKTGSYNLYIQRLTAPAHARVIVAGETLTGAISVLAEADSFRWSAGASDRLRVTVTTTDGALLPGVRVFDPSGTQVCEAINSYRTSVEIADCLLPRSGVYTILVGDSLGTRTGTYRIGVTCVISSCGAAYTAVIGSEGGTVSAGELQIDIPPGAFIELTTIQVTPHPTTTVSGTGSQRLVRSFAILAFGAGNAAVTTAAHPLVYTELYADLDLITQGITTSNLRMAFWDASAQSWATVTDSLSGTRVSATSAAITDVALLAVATSQPQSQVYLPLLRR